MSQFKIRLHHFMANLAIILLVATGIFVPHSEARVVAEEFIEKGKKIVVLQNVRDEDGVLEGMAISGPNGLEVRVDSDGDGEVDWRKIESGEYEIEQSWPSNGIFHRMKVVRKLAKERVEALFFLARDRKGYELWKIEKRPYEVMYAGNPFGKVDGSKAKPSFGSLTPASASFGQLPQASQARQTAPKPSVSGTTSGSDAFCSLRTIADPFSDDWKKLAQTIEVDALVQSPGAKSLIGKTCEQNSGLILQGVAEILLPSQNRGNRFFACMAKLDSLSKNANHALFKFWDKVYRSGTGPLFQCSDDMGADKLAKYDEKGKPPFTLNPMLFVAESKDDVAKALFHELSHASGIHDEKQVERIVSCCSNRFDSSSRDCADAAGEAEKSVSPRLLQDDGIARILGGLEFKDPEARDLVSKEMLKIIDDEMKATGCPEVGVVTNSCKEKFRAAIVAARAKNMDRFCVPSLGQEECKRIGDLAIAEVDEQLAGCISGRPGNVCDRSVNQGAMKFGGRDTQERVKREMSKERAAPVLQSQRPKSGEIPPMHYQSLQGDDVQQMRVAAQESQGLVSRAVARVRKSLEHVDTRVIPRAEAASSRRRERVDTEMPVYASFRKDGSPVITLANGSPLQLVQPFDIDTAGNAPTKNRGAIVASIGGNAKGKDVLGAVDMADNIGRGSQGATSSTRKPSAIGISDSGSKSGGDNARARSNLPTVPPRGGAGSNIEIKNEEDARAALSKQLDPESLAGTPWFENRLRDLKIQIVGGRRIYGVQEPEVPLKRWNISLFPKRESL